MNKQIRRYPKDKTLHEQQFQKGTEWSKTDLPPKKKKKIGRRKIRGRTAVSENYKIHEDVSSPLNVMHSVRETPEDNGNAK
jgi:hypothetical protein